MSLHSEVTGSGRDLVLLHGWGMNAGIWEPLAQELSPHFRVHAVDLPGHGASALCDPYTLAEMASELAQRMPERSLVCGWSLGGQLALAWADRAPQQVERLVLVATTPCFTRRTDWPHAMEETVLRDFARGLAEDHVSTLRRFIALQALGDGKSRQVLLLLKENLRSRAAPDVRALDLGLKILLESDLRARMSTIGQPVMIFHGDRDALIPLAAAEYLQRELPNAQLVIMRGAAHAPFISDAAEFSAQLTDFFQ